MSFGVALIFTLAGCGARTELHLDGTLPFDAGPDVVDDDSHVPPGCDGGAQEIWLLSQRADEPAQLYVFDPVTVVAKQMSSIDCDVALNSMSVSRSNVGYLGAHDGSLYTVDLATGHCSPTAFDPTAYGLNSYGMGFATVPVPAGETLFIAPQTANNEAYALGTIDVYGSLRYSVVGPIRPSLPATEVTGTGDGRLYGVHVSDPVLATNGELFQFDKTNAAIFDRVPLPIFGTYVAFDFAFWGGSFYIFIAYAGAEQHSHVIRYTPGQGGAQEIATIDPFVIGAGVSTCAPF